MSRGSTANLGEVAEPKDKPTMKTGENDVQAAAATSEAADHGRISSPAGDARALRILAKSVYRELRASGHSRSDIVGVTNALLELVTTDLKSGDQ